MRSSFKGLAFGIAGGWLLAAILPCSVLFAEEAQTISAVEVQEDGDATRIVLRGAEEPIYTAFMREDPPRLIIDLPEVTFEGIATPLRVGNGLVSNVMFGEFGDPQAAWSMGRVSIGLSQLADYEVLPDGQELIVVLRPSATSVSDAAGSAAMPSAPVGKPTATPAETVPETDTASEADSMTPEDATVETDAEPTVSPEATTDTPAEEPPTTADADNEPEPMETATATPTSRILNVVGGSDEIRVIAEGPIDNVDSFALETPARLVFDFWGARSTAWPATVAVDEGPVQRIRIGDHADKVRIVLDLRTPVLTHTVEPSEEGVRIRVEAESVTADEADAAAETDAPPAAPAEASEAPTPKPGDATVGETPEPSNAMIGGTPEWIPPEEDEPEIAEATNSEAPGEPEPMESVPAMPSEPMKPTRMAAPAYPSEGPVWIQSVHFESLPAVDRVVVNLSGPAEAKLVRPDPVTVIVDLPSVSIDAEQERRVDTREFGGPVEIFSVFRTPEVPGEQVRVVLKRHGSARPQMEWAGNRLSIEIPRPGSEAAGMPMPGDPPGSPTSPSADVPAATLDAMASAPAAPRPGGGVPMPPMPSMSAESFADDPGFDGPADPAAIDLLEEGGFSREKEYQGRRISLDFKDADIGNILRLIAEVSDLNVIAGEEVSGKVTIRLVDVPWDQALDVILLTKGLGFVRIGNVLRIAPLATLQREEQARLQERRAKEKLEDLIVKLQPVNYANVNEVSQLVKRLLSPRGTVNVDGRTNTLIIKDIPSVIHEATALVKAIDTQTPQVLIEAKVVEATLDFSRSLGAIWGIGYNPTGRGGRQSLGGAQDLHLADAVNDRVPGTGPGKQGSHFVVSNPVATSIGTLTMGLLGLDDHIQLDLQLQAAETNNKGKVISSPRVVTLDNREATIQQGVAIAFEASDGDNVSTSFVDAVLELRVTPHITADKSIIMKIKVSRNAPQLSNATGAVVGIAKNETSTEALVRDGQTMVLGGIYTVDKGRDISKVPFLADIPLLGTAFRNSTSIDIRNELLIFVTPRVVQVPATGA